MLEDNKESLDRENLLKKLKKEIINTNFYEAKSISIELGLKEEEILNIASEIYNKSIKEKEFEKAFKIANRYAFKKNKIFIAALKEFQRLAIEGDVDEAVKWSKKAKDIGNFEINKIIIKAFEELVERRNVEKAVELFEKFGAPAEIVLEECRNTFNKAFEIGDYSTALFLGKKFGFSQKRTLTAAARELSRLIRLKNFEKIICISEEFDIFNDSVFEVIDTEDAEDLTEAFIDMIDYYLDINKFEFVISIFDKMNVLYKKYENEVLFDMIDSIYEKLALCHNRLLIQDKIKEAMEFKDKFELLGSHIPFEAKKAVIESAQVLHNLFMDFYDYDKAQSIKLDYRLFDENIIENSRDVSLKSSIEFLIKTLTRAEFHKSKKVIEDYKIPWKNVLQTTVKVMLEKFNVDGYKDAIEILKIFKINPYEKDIQIKALRFFKDMILAKKYEAAADIGLYFELDREETLKTAIIAWKERIDEDNFEEAYKIKMRHKIPIVATNKILKKVYRKKLRENELKICRTIRKQYSLNISIFLLIIEFIKRIIFWK